MKNEIYHNTLMLPTSTNIPTCATIIQFRKENSPKEMTWKELPKITLLPYDQSDS